MSKLLKYMLTPPDSIKAHMTTRHYEKNRHILSSGQTNEYLYILVEGSAKIYSETHQGTILPLRTLFAPDTFGILEVFDPSLKTQSVMTTSDSTIISLQRQHLLKWMSLDFDFNMFIFELYAQCFRQSNTLSLQLASMTLRERVLLTLYHYHMGQTLHLLTKDLLMEKVSSPKRSLNRVLSDCYQEGFLLYEKKKFIVSDEKKLMQLVELLL